jgi:hypothetical protein
MQAVQKGRERLQVVIEPEPEPVDEYNALAEDDDEEEDERTFFDQDAR